MSRVICLALSLMVPSLLSAQSVASDQLAQLKYRHIGPEGNRVVSAKGVPGNPLIYYAGAASGGIWKTTDGGTFWEPIFDKQPVHSIGALAVAPSDPNVIWAGTGEANIRSHISIGAGVFKSTDAGKTWARAGLENTGRISRLAVDPRNPDVVFAAAMGHSYGPQQERGIYRTRDGGATWQQVLFVDQHTGASDVVMDPNNPRILFAGMWQLVIQTWGRHSGGPGSGIYMSRDGGDTWKRLEGSGLPKMPHGKVALAIARSNSQRVYALIETGDGVPMWNGQETESGELWRSDDGGDSWKLITHDRDLAGRTHYYSRVEVSPTDDMEAYFLSASFNRTLNGGESVITSSGRSSPWGDNHDIWIDPLDPDRMIVANDGGVDISVNRGETWRRVELPIAQMYHVTVDNQIPYYVYGNRQDGPSARGPSRTFYTGFGGSAGNIPRGDWIEVGGGESGFATPDPEDPNVIWSTASGAGAVGGIVTRMDLASRQIHDVEVWPKSTIGWPAGELRYRFIWDPPLTISPHDRHKVYTASQHVHVTTNGGRSWSVISPDLTRNDTSRMKPSGGLTPDNIGVEYSGVVFAVEESPVTAGVIWAGTNDGLVHVTRDGGATWTNVTRNLPGLPTWGSIRNIEASRYDAGTAYLTVDGHQANNRDPWIYRTRDYGRTWTLIVNGIPKSPMSYAHAIAEDPVRRGLLYAGTENAIYVSFNDGDAWQPLQTNMPHSPVYWIVVQPHFNDLVVATYGRGFWILDDLTPLQQLTPAIASGSGHLFAPRPAYRFRDQTPPFAPYQDQTIGQNPPYGASLNFYAASASPDSATIEVLDAGGQLVRSMKSGVVAGINRAWWDLRYDASIKPVLRTAPLHASWVSLGDSGRRDAPGLGPMSILAPPGRYTVRLSMGGRQYTQPLEVRKDPKSPGTEAEIAQATALMFELRSDLDDAMGVINGAELVRSQLQALRRTLDTEDRATVREAASELEAKFTTVEAKLYQLYATGRGQDMIRWPSRTAQQIGYLAGKVESSDFAPTQQQREVAAELSGEVRAAKAEYDALVRADLATFNAMLAREGVQGVVSAPRAVS